MSAAVTAVSARTTPTLPVAARAPTARLARLTRLEAMAVANRDSHIAPASLQTTNRTFRIRQYTQ